MSELSPAAHHALARIRQLGRRDFLKFGAIACGVAVAAGGGPLSSAAAAPPPPIKVMSEADYAVFERLMEVMFPLEGTSLVPLKDIPVLATLDGALLATMEPSILKGLRDGIAYFNNGPVALTGRRFTELSNEEAAKFCDAWANSADAPQRALAVGLKKLVGLAYWANPPTWAPLGYDGPVSDAWRVDSLGNAPLPKS